MRLYAADVGGGRLLVSLWYSSRAHRSRTGIEMSLIVCKFGGTSVASPERIRNVAKRLVARKQAGHQVVAVVSAMGKTTDELVGLAAAVNPNPPTREMDRLLSTGEQVSMSLLAMAIEARGYQAMSFTGRQAGIVIGAKP